MANIFLAYLGISVTVGIVVLLILLASPFINRRYAAKWKYFIWIFLAVRLLIPVSGMYYKKSDKPAANGTAAYEPAEIQNVQPRRYVVEIPIEISVGAAGQTISKSDTKSGVAAASLFDIAFAVWLAGTVVFAAVPVLSCVHYKRRIMRHGERIGEGPASEMMLFLKKELNIKRKVMLIRYSQAASPMVIGFIRPILVLPCDEYSDEELYFIIRHELIHLRRGDVYIKLLCVLANAVHWFNPLIWIMRKEAAIDMELSCDEGVIKGADFGVKKAYTETLMSSLRRQSAKRSSLTTQFYGGKGTMKKRFTNILGRGAKKNGIAVLMCAILLAALLSVLVGCTQKTTSDGEVGKENVTDSTNTGDEVTPPVTEAETETKTETVNDNPAEDITTLANEILENLEQNHLITVNILTMNKTEPVMVIEGVDQLGNLRIIDGATYIPMQEDYDTIDEIMEVFHKVYTKEKCDTLYSRYLDEDNTGFMKEVDGKLYCIAGDMVYSSYNLPIESAERISETEILAKTSATYDSGDVPFEITLEYEDGEWKIDRLIEYMSEEGRELSY